MVQAGPKSHGGGRNGGCFNAMYVPCVLRASIGIRCLISKYTIGERPTRCGKPDGRAEGDGSEDCERRVGENLRRQSEGWNIGGHCCGLKLNVNNCLT